MNRWVSKLLRQQLCGGQLLGFFLANLFGMSIILLGWQFYQDVLPVFSQGDSFMKENYLVLGKRVTTVQTLMGEHPHFSSQEIAELEQQPFVKHVGPFVAAQFDVSASVGSPELGIGMTTDLFLESIPDNYIDADLSQWHYEEGSDSLPIILPRNYLNIYNFGFAATRGLPVLSEALIGMVHLDFDLRGTHGQCRMKGKVVDFSDRINTILVPQEFLEAYNARLSPDRSPVASRLIVEVEHAADDRVAVYLNQHHYEEEGNLADAGRMVYFLHLLVGIVLLVGLVICALSFYVLLLSIFLLLQRHTEKIDILLQLGYTPMAVARPFHLLSLSLNGSVLLLSGVLVTLLRSGYLPLLEKVYPQMETGNLWSAYGIGLLLYLLVSVLNYYAIRKKVNSIWYIHREKS